MIRRYLVEVLEEKQGDESRYFRPQFYARIGKDGRVTQPSDRRGPTVFATEQEAGAGIERVRRNREARRTFEKWDVTFPVWDYRIVPIHVPVKTITLRTSLEIPVEGAGERIRREILAASKTSKREEDSQ